jgi:drug/metabolite transporter (DMT)-like permease
MQSKPAQRLALMALLGGAAGIGFAPIFVRLSDVGPSATAFYRLLFSLPILWLVAGLEGKGEPPLRTIQRRCAAPEVARSPYWICALAGLFFACDLAFWHWSIRLTSVANSTLLTNCAPFFVMLGARFWFAEEIRAVLILGMVVASIGAAMLVGATPELTPKHLTGDLLALITAVFYGGYLLTVKYLRFELSTARILAWSGLVSCGLLLLIAVLSHESIRIQTGRGWIVLVSLGLVSHIGGQGLIAFALAHLPAGFSSVGLLLQPVVAALLAWLILSEPLNLWQGIGGAIILLGIGLAGTSRR